MSDHLTERLNQVLPKVTSEDFLKSRGIGNEIGFYIFDYPPEEELQIRGHIRFLLEHIPKCRPGTRVAHIDLFDFVVAHLRQRNLLDKAFQLQKEKGNEFVLRHLEKILHPSKLTAAFVAVAQPEAHDLVLVSGVGSVYPMLRAHTLLNNLHPVMGRTPLVMFYPGRYDGQSFRLFDRIANENYYRAFRLVP